MKPNRKKWSEVQKRIIAEKQKWKCPGISCKRRKYLGIVWELDHIIALANGGLDEFDNLQILCSHCHAVKTQSERVNSAFQKRMKNFLTDNSKCCIYFHKSQRWQVLFPYSIKIKSRYFSSTRYGSVEKARFAALDWCKENKLLITFCSQK
jgi:hypothetical protein